MKFKITDYVTITDGLHFGCIGEIVKTKKLPCGIINYTVKLFRNGDYMFKSGIEYKFSKKHLSKK